MIALVTALGVTGVLWVSGGGGGRSEPPREPPGPRATPVADAPRPPAATVPTGRFLAAPGEGEVAGSGPLRTYRVEVEEGSGVAAADFARVVEEIVGDPRGWTTAEGISLQRVEGDADMVVALATPPTVDLLCFPLDTDGDVSCANEGRAVINLERWRTGAAPSRLTLPDYRRYLVSHEIGHLLGHGHVECPGPGAPAPVMVQQTLGIGECAPNPWPAPAARATG